MLTEPVPADVAALLDLRRDLPLLTPAQRREAGVLVVAAVEALLEALPAGTPEPLVDAICGLCSVAAEHLEVSDLLETPVL